MTESEFKKIETKLKIKLPASYRQLHDVEQKLLAKFAGGEKSQSQFYLTAEHLIESNLLERKVDSDTAIAFPKWWKTFVLIGTNGGGDFYTVRLDNAPGVWVIGSDCGTEPTLESRTLKSYVTKLVKKLEQAKAARDEQAWIRAPFQGEIDTELDILSRIGGSEDAKDWASTESSYWMISQLNPYDKPPPINNPRKIRLYGIALCRMIPDLESDKELAVGMTVARAMTRGACPPDRFLQMRLKLEKRIQRIMKARNKYNLQDYISIYRSSKAVYNLFRTDEELLANDGVRPDDPDIFDIYCDVGYILTGFQYGVDLATHLLREVYGNPFHPVEFLAKWRTRDSIALARSMDNDDNFDRMPELGRLLESAGCDDQKILAHCRRTEHHVRGCWVVDKVLGLDKT